MGSARPTETSAQLLSAHLSAGWRLHDGRTLSRPQTVDEIDWSRVHAVAGGDGRDHHGWMVLGGRRAERTRPGADARAREDAVRVAIGWLGAARVCGASLMSPTLTASCCDAGRRAWARVAAAEGAASALAIAAAAIDSALAKVHRIAAKQSIGADTAIDIACELDEAYYTLVYERLRTDNVGAGSTQRGARDPALGSLIAMPHVWFAEMSCLFAGRKRAMRRFLRQCHRRLDATALAAFLAGFDWDASADADAMRIKTADNPLLQLHRAKIIEAVCMVFDRDVDRLRPRRDGRGAAEAVAMEQQQQRQRKRKRGGGNAAAAIRRDGDGDTQLPMSPLLSRYWQSARTFPCYLYAFATPNASALRALRRHAPVVEVGAGVGYWSSMMRHAGIDVSALDVAPSQTDDNEYHGRAVPWTRVHAMPAGCGNAAREHHRREGVFKGRTLFLCYTPPGEPMAAEALENYMVANVGREDNVVIVVGESKGDTGSPAFDALLSREFSLCEVIALPNWPDTAHEMTIWKTKGHGGAPSPQRLEFPAMKCASCGHVLSARLPVRRCRYCRDPLGTFCSQACCTRGLMSHRACHHVRMISTVSNEAMAKVDSDVHYERIEL